jgi:phospholipase/carboxylesterase
VFSQGAFLASEYAARNPRKYGGVAALSGGLLGAEVDPSAYDGSLDGAPVLLGVGDSDPNLSVERVHETAAVFRALDGDVNERVYEGVGHEVTDDEFAVVGSWLDGIVGDEA